MKVLRNVSIGGWGKAAVTVFVVAVVFFLPLGQQTSMAAQRSAPLTQMELIQWLVHMRGAEGSIPDSAKFSEYVQWALSQNLSPSGGWNPNAELTRSDFAQVLA